MSNETWVTIFIFLLGIIIGCLAFWNVRQANSLEKLNDRVDAVRDKLESHEKDERWVMAEKIEDIKNSMNAILVKFAYFEANCPVCKTNNKSHET